MMRICRLIYDEFLVPVIRLLLESTSLSAFHTASTIHIWFFEHLTELADLYCASRNNLSHHRLKL